MGGRSWLQLLELDSSQTHLTVKLHACHFFYNLAQIALPLWSGFLNRKMEIYWFAEGIK